MDTVLLIIIGVLVGYIVFKEILFHQQMKNILDRFMAKNLTEYKATEMVPEDKVNTISDPDSTVALDDVPNPFSARPKIN